MLPRRLGLPCAALLACAACSSIDGDLFEPAPDAAPAPPATTLVYAGSYDATQRWDLSAMFLDDEGLGGLVADLVVDAAVRLAGVPGALEDDARELVADAIRAPIRDYVNARVPDELVPRSALLAQLAEIFADVEIEGVLGLAVAGDPDALFGTEKIEAIRLTYQGATYDVPIEALLEEVGGYALEADITGRATGQTTLTIDDHALALQVGTIVSLAGVELLDRDDLEALTAQALAAISCADLIALVAAGDPPALGIEVGGESFSVAATDLVAGCEDGKLSLGDYVVGYFDRHLPVTVGGALTMTDADGDGAVDALAGTPSYRGEAALLSGLVAREFPIELDASHQ